LHARQTVTANAAGTAPIDGLTLAAGTYFINIRNGENGESLKLTVTE
jgi:hypothetical protein